MTRDEIMQLVQQAWDTPNTSFFEAFASLVAAHEREQCAKVCEARAGEEVGMAYGGIALDCADAIRARGET